MTTPLLEIHDLCVEYIGKEQRVKALDRVSLSIGSDEIVGIAGESGSGKSTLAYAILRILAAPAVITGGQVLFDGEDVLTLSPERLRALRWREIAIVFQSAMNALNPVISIGAQIADVLKRAPEGEVDDNHARIEELLEMVNLESRCKDAYAHELSGGMRQRAVIAIALALDPRLLILDEPTTALDALLQREILSGIVELRRRRGRAALLVSHDLAAMLDVCHSVAILYAGRVAETLPARSLQSDAARHPYTQELLASYPSLHGPRRHIEGIAGAPPNMQSPPSGCRFHPRCAFCEPVCREEQPRLIKLTTGHHAACHCL